MFSMFFVASLAYKRQREMWLTWVCQQLMLTKTEKQPAETQKSHTKKNLSNVFAIL